MLKFMLAHFLTLAVMLPVGLCVLAPAGNVIATAIAGAFVKIPEILGPVGVGIVCLVWPLLVAVGMHMPVAMLAFGTFLTVGHEDVCFIADNLQHYVAMGVSLAFAVRAIKKDDRTLGVSSFVSMFMGGVIEPTIFGIAFPHKRYLGAMLLANGIAGFFASLFHVGAYALSSSNIFGILSFSGGTNHNLVFGIISAVVAFAGGFVLSFIFDLLAGKKNKAE
jgi:PTS system beta-glucosides-specific IIC component